LSFTVSLNSVQRGRRTVGHAYSIDRSLSVFHATFANKSSHGEFIYRLQVDRELYKPRTGVRLLIYLQLHGTCSFKTTCSGHEYIGRGILLCQLCGDVARLPSTAMAKAVAWSVAGQPRTAHILTCPLRDSERQSFTVKFAIILTHHRCSHGVAPSYLSSVNPQVPCYIHYFAPSPSLFVKRSL
jgi:hypothetical protein